MGDQNFLYVVTMVPLWLVVVALCCAIALYGIIFGVMGAAFSLFLSLLLYSAIETHVFKPIDNLLIPNAVYQKECRNKPHVKVSDPKFGEDGCFPEKLARKNLLIKKVDAVYGPCEKNKISGIVFCKDRRGNLALTNTYDVVTTISDSEMDKIIEYYGGQ